MDNNTTKQAKAKQAEAERLARVEAEAKAKAEADAKKANKQKPKNDVKKVKVISNFRVRLAYSDDRILKYKEVAEVVHNNEVKRAIKDGLLTVIE